MKKNVEKTKEKVTQVFNQAKQSFKLLETTLERGTLAKAKTFVKIPVTADLLSNLKRLGVSSQSEVDALRARVEKLEAALELQSRKSDTSEAQPQG